MDTISRVRCSCALLSPPCRADTCIEGSGRGSGTLPPAHTSSHVQTISHQQANKKSVHVVIEARLLQASLCCDLTATNRKLEAPQDTSEDLCIAREVNSSHTEHLLQVLLPYTVTICINKEQEPLEMGSTHKQCNSLVLNQEYT